MIVRAGVKIHFFPEVESTMDVARELARRGETGAVVADIQRRGRGRHGRTWLSPRGGLYLTLILRSAPPRLSLLPLAAGVAVARALRRLYGIEVRLKWPNDLLYRERKLGGILLEASFHREIPEFILLGLGLNLNTPVSGEEPRAISLLEILGHRVDRDELLRVLLAEILHSLELSPEDILRSWKSLSATLGQEVRVHTPHGEIRGRALDLTPQGGLLLETPEGLREVLSGDCIHLRST